MPKLGEVARVMILLGNLQDYRKYKHTPEFKRLATALYAGLLSFHEFDLRVHRAVNYQILKGVKNEN